MIDLGQMAWRLKEARIRNGLSQEAVERITGLSIRTVRRCETNGTTNLITLEKLCKAYTVNIYDMIGGSNDLVRLAETINRLGPDACEVLKALCQSIHGLNADS